MRRRVRSARGGPRGAARAVAESERLRARGRGRAAAEARQRVNETVHSSRGRRDRHQAAAEWRGVPDWKPGPSGVARAAALTGRNLRDSNFSIR